MPESAEIKAWESSTPKPASVVENSLHPSVATRRPTDMLLIARRETKRDYSGVMADSSRQAAAKPFVVNSVPNTNSISRRFIDPQELEQVDLFLIDDGQEPGNSLDESNASSKDQAATQNIAIQRAEFRETLNRPLPADPIELSLRYIDDNGKTVPESEFRLSLREQFAKFNSNPFGDEICRLDACDCCWYAKSYVWKSPDLCYGPLYFEEVNLERFGGRFPLMQPAISAVHFVGNTVRLPYSMGLQSPHHCVYSAGYGRAGNQYCYQCERPVWSLKGGTFQALLVTGLIFGLP